jgi:hypothetical protein
MSTYRVVYGVLAKPVQIASGMTEADANEYAALMNARAPQYEHRVEVEVLNKKEPRAPRRGV